MGFNWAFEGLSDHIKNRVGGACGKRGRNDKWIQDLVLRRGDGWGIPKWIVRT
jgi:hypothetical protein